MKVFNPHMLSIARNSRGLTQKALINLLPKVNQSTISRLERGELRVSDDILKAIADALQYPVDFFYQVDTKTPVSNIYFRKRAALNGTDFNKIMAEISIILKSIDTLLEDVEIKEYPKYIFDITEGWTPESAASRMREILQIPNGKPVKDIIKRIEELGIIVFFYDSPNSEFDGLTSYTDNGVPVIFVNKNKPNDRIKFTVVHELFHLVLHIPCNIQPWRDYEAEANLATGEFFMPANDCVGDLRGLSYNKLANLKSYWGISKASIIHRAKDLNLITAETFKYLMIELGRKGERKNELGYVDLDPPQITSTIINLLKNELNYTKIDLSNKMYLSANDYMGFFEPQINGVKLKVISKSA